MTEQLNLEGTQPQENKPTENKEQPQQYVTLEAFSNFANEIKGLFEAKQQPAPAPAQEKSPVLQQIEQEEQEKSNLEKIKLEADNNHKLRFELNELGNKLGGTFKDVLKKHEGKYNSKQYNTAHANKEVISDFVTAYSQDPATKNSIMQVYKKDFDDYLSLPLGDRVATAEKMLTPLHASFEKFTTEQIARGGSNVAGGTQQNKTPTDYFFQRRREKSKK